MAISTITTYVSTNNITDYDFLDQAYNGTGGFKKGEYITPHWREKDFRYERRQKDAYYPNILKPIITGHVEPLFKTEPIRDLGEDEFLLKIQEDCDNKGNSINIFMKRQTREARLQGKVYILVENSSKPETNKARAIKNRSLPYLVAITKNRVDEDSVLYDDFGNISEITYSIVSQEKDDKGKLQNVTTYKTWSSDSWILKSAKGEELGEGENKLGFVPIVQYYGVDEDNVSPQSDFYHIAKANHRLYNVTSNIQEQEDNQMYPVLTLPKSGGSQQNIGTASGLEFSPDAKKGPAYISPPVDPIKVLAENAANLIIKMYDMANLAIIKSVAGTSGESKRWDYERTETALSGTALQAENTELNIWNVIQKYLAKTIDISITYSRKFTFVDSDQEIQNALDILSMNLGPAGNAEIKKVSVKNAIPYIPNEKAEIINESIDDQAKIEDQNDFEELD